MSDSVSTLETRIAKSSPVTGGHGEDLTALMIAWAAAEPRRVGEIALFEAEGTALVLGRGEPPGSSPGERVTFLRQRPGLLERQPPLTSKGISREQLRIRLEGVRLWIERVGKCPLEKNGEPLDHCYVEPGDTLLLGDQLLLFCTRRPRKLPAPLGASCRDPPAFGASDAHGIVGESPAAWRLRDQIARIADADEHTLILGETGAGKELAARAIYALSARVTGPFVARNAATIPASLIDAELFGNVRDYPNPGTPERPGLVGSAHRGTLFLDEIGQLAPDLQANLLRVLDGKGEYHRLGAAATMRSDFRFLGATNSDPAELKHDLSPRLKLRLCVPSLAERRDDIPFLARHLLQCAVGKNPKATKRFFDFSTGSVPEPKVEAKLIEHLLRRRYSDNIRELDAILWRAMFDSPGDVIEWRPSTPSRKGVATSYDVEPTPGLSVAVAVASLKAHGCNIVHTARALGMSRYALHRFVKKHGIDVDELRALERERRKKGR